MIPHDPITSVSNPRVREAVRLRDADGRRATGLTLVDGRRELKRAADTGIEILEVFCDAGAAPDHDREAWLGALQQRGTRITLLAARPFEKVAFGSRNEGLVGLVRFSGKTLRQFGAEANRPVIVVDGVEKPGNLGAILRTADAAGIAGVIACDPRTDPANPATIRASLGTVFSMPLAVATLAEAIAWCGGKRRRVLAAMPDGRVLWHESRLAGTTAIVLGSEAQGISPQWQQAAADGLIDFESVRLPMRGRADSLNVSATAAVLAYESLRQAPEKP